MTDENLSIWGAVQKTDPSKTKPITGKGYKGTATNPTWLAMRATEHFGPCGIGWGVTVLDEKVIDGATLGESVYEKTHRVHAKFWYIWNGKRGEIEHFGQTILSGRRNDGKPFTDEDACKKSLTDAMTKAMSLLGFAADIHLGLYDDSKYVADLKREKAAEGETQQRVVPLRQAASAPNAASALREKARNLAREGSKIFDKWWGTLTDEQCNELGAIADELAEIGRAADQAENLRAG